MYRPMDFTTWLSIIYRHRIFVTFYIFHYPICRLIANDKFCLILSLHEVFNADRKMIVLGAHLQLTPLDMDEQWYGLILWHSDFFHVVANTNLF